jgi:hypothetical protein
MGEFDGTQAAYGIAKHVRPSSHPYSSGKTMDMETKIER